MQYVKKDKLTELLAEKLCARLAASETDRQARAVSYCLGQLKVGLSPVLLLPLLHAGCEHDPRAEPEFGVLGKEYVPLPRAKDPASPSLPMCGPPLPSLCLSRHRERR